MSRGQRYTSTGASTRCHAVHAPNELHVQSDEWWRREPFQEAANQLGHGLARIHANGYSLAWACGVWVVAALWFVT